MAHLIRSWKEPLIQHCAVNSIHLVLIYGHVTERERVSVQLRSLQSQRELYVFLAGRGQRSTRQIEPTVGASHVACRRAEAGVAVEPSVLSGRVGAPDEPIGEH